MSQNVLNSLPIIAHAIGRSCGVKVRCGGQAACTDGRVVVLPDSDSVPRNVLLGYLVHECAHVRYTDFSLSFPHTIVRWLTNVYEDARIERKINREYIGANRLLQATMRHLQTESTKTPTDPVETLLSFAALDCWSRYRLMGDVLEEPYRRAESQVRQWFSVGDLQTIRSINDELPLAKDTAHCRQMAQRLFDWLKTKASSSDANASESSATKDPSDDAQTDNGRSSPDKSPSSTDDATSVAGHDQVADASMSAKRTQDLSLSASIERAVAHGHGDFVWDAKGLSMFDISEKMKSQLEGTSQQAGLLPSGLLESKSLATTILTDKARAIIDAGRRNSIGLRRQLQGLVQARSRDQKRMTQSGHRVNPRRISRLSVWNPRVFTRLQLHESTATAVHLLLDMSGSMRGERERIAAESAVALFLALTALPHCNPALTIFQGRGHAKAIFRHGETLDDRTKARVSEIDASGGTPLFQALGDILVDLAQTREKRKVIFVITDGDPDDPRETHRLVKAIEASDGIEIVGIGINAETSWLFDRSVRLDEIEKLPDVLFGLAKETALTGIQ